MAPEAVVAERAYLQLKSDIVSGRFGPGALLVERALAAEYGVSIVPFRDGAQRLVGEALLEPGPNGGYRMPLLSEAGVRDLYVWHYHLARLALRTAAIPLVPDPARVGIPFELGKEDIAASATALFRAIALRSANKEVARSLLVTNDRLHLVRLREANVIEDLAKELKSLIDATVTGSEGTSFRALRAYHRRRIRRAHRIAGALIDH